MFLFFIDLNPIPAELWQVCLTVHTQDPGQHLQWWLQEKVP